MQYKNLVLQSLSRASPCFGETENTAPTPFSGYLTTKLKQMLTNATKYPFHVAPTPFSGHLTSIYRPQKIKLRRSSLLSRPDKRNCKVKISMVEQSPPRSTLDTKQFVDFLYEDPPHILMIRVLIRQTTQDEHVKFQNPIAKHDTASGCLFNIAMLKNILTPDLYLHQVKPVIDCFLSSQFYLHIVWIV